MAKTNSTTTSRIIHADRATLYRAFTEPDALATWLAPSDMRGKVHEFDGREGGGYRMSLYYPTTEPAPRGKTTDLEDAYTARFVELTPPSRIVTAIQFAASDPAFAGEMTMTVTLEATDDSTKVTIHFDDIPPGISPADNDAGTQSSLEKLARYVE